MTEALYGTLAAPLVAGDLRLRALARSDEAALTASFDDDDLWTWMLASKPETPDAVLAWLDDALERVAAREHVAFVLERADGTLAGTTRFLDVSEYDRTLEIGWTLVFANARGTGLNARAKALLLARAFDAGFVRVQLKTDVRNLRSRAAIAALGATFEGVLRKFQRRADGSNRDSAVFSIVAEDWPNVRRALDARTSRRKGPV